MILLIYEKSDVKSLAQSHRAIKYYSHITCVLNQYNFLSSVSLQSSGVNKTLPHEMPANTHIKNTTTEKTATRNNILDYIIITKNFEEFKRKFLKYIY